MTMQLGVNLRGPDKAEEDLKRSNLLIDIGGWAVDGSGVPIPMSSFTPADFTAPGATPTVPCLTHPATWGYAPAGDYTFRAQGAGTLDFGGAWSFTGSAGQSHTYHLPGPFAQATLTIRSVDGGDPLANLRMLGPRSDDTSFFTPAYLEALKGFKVLRAMDWLIGVSSTANPYNLPPLGDFGYAAEITDWSQADLRPGRGPRGLCDLLLALKAVHGTSPDLWVNIPYRCAYFTGPAATAVTGYIRTFGAYLAARVPPGTNVYVELANEPWNFKIYDDWLVAQTNIGLAGSPRYAAQGMLSAAAWEAFETGFGRDCIRVLNGQYVWPENNLVDALDKLRALGKRVDAIASAPYWWISPNSTVGSDPIKAAWAGGDHPGALTLFFAALHSGIALATGFMADWRSIASTYGVRNICYEGGISVPGYFFNDPVLGQVWAAASEDSRLATETGNYLTALSAFVDLFNWFTHAGVGTWGAARDASDWGSPRMNGLRAWNGLGPMDPAGTYASDGYGSTGAGYLPTPAPTTPAITWPDPSPIAYPAPLSATELDATTGVAGTFVYTPPAGTILGVGNTQPLSTTFIPDDQAHHNIAVKRASLDVIPGAVAAGSCAFLRLDAATQGTWIGAYGAEGYSIEGTPAALPSYAAVVFSAVGTATWAASTADVRALQVPGRQGGRAIGQWYAYPALAFTLDVTFSGGLEHDLAIYLIDWDSSGRTQTVVVKDPLSGEIYDRRTISAFVGGIYLVYRLGGHVQLTIARTAGVSTVASGLFLDAAASPTPTPTPTGRWRRWSPASGRPGGRGPR